MNPYYARRGYLVNFERMVQINFMTKYERPVRRLEKCNVVDYPVWIYSIYYLYKFCQSYHIGVSEEANSNLMMMCKEQGLFD